MPEIVYISLPIAKTPNFAFLVEYNCYGTVTGTVCWYFVNIIDLIWNLIHKKRFKKIHTLSLAGTLTVRRYLEFWKCVFTLTRTESLVQILDSRIVVWTSNSEDFITSTLRLFPSPLIIPWMDTSYTNHILLPQILATTSSPMFSNKTSFIVGLISSEIATLAALLTFSTLGSSWIRAILTSWVYRSNWCWNRNKNIFS